ncbi:MULTISPECIES: alpha/beta fold hydrolase [Paraburkholderia]|uniref:alpha/beta fold hydrolase n=1 Tax=Paraburkholderia TaxID=1822464 RepID=UPI0022532A54|nr:MULTISPECIES: alpha/beta fold hydrolase [Paraburkholderia]MCX4163671.1 alpha/beta fold hydrolase [Paraburkholderia megapolitana]MDN7159166.1 alpha/beta fold hydrolase [Paraburkholderia sp. CHISQ3]MDQ6496213.1 alpha/beta fold hydrolase [Paraburkholderia megapolitana]
MKKKQCAETWIQRGLFGIAMAIVLAGCSGNNISEDQSGNGPVPVSNAAVGDGGVPSFYVWTSTVPSKPGRILRQQPLDANLALANSDPAKNIRGLYTSTDGVNGKTPVAVSGAVYVPKGSPPVGGWPVIAWTHGTVGVADVCAQSFRQRSDRDQAYLGTLLAEGYAVVATDYQGLGTPGPHPYLVPRAEAYDTLDNLRAAFEALPGVLANTVVSVGQSQGSAATIATLQYAPVYAPEINVVGGVATGVCFGFAGANPAPQIPPRAADAGNSVYDMLALVGTGPSVEPGFDARPYVSDRALPLFVASTKECITDLDTVQESNGVDESNYLKAPQPPDKIDPVLAAISTPVKGFTLKAPLFTGTGLADTTTPPTSAYTFISTACTLDATIEWNYYAGLTHNGTVNGSLVDSLPFIRKVLAGRPVTSNCSALTVPGPTQAPTPGLPFNT